MTSDTTTVRSPALAVLQVRGFWARLRNKPP
jgi:hypothetical protein